MLLVSAHFVSQIKSCAEKKEREKTKKKNTNVIFFPKRARRSGGVSL